MSILQKLSVLSSRLQQFFVKTPQKIQKTDDSFELYHQDKIAAEWKQCRQVIVDSANRYLRMHWGKERGFLSVLTTGVQGHQRAQSLKQFVYSLDLSNAKGQRDLIASVSAIRLSSSTNLTGELDQQLKRLKSKTFDVNQFNLNKLSKREQELKRFFDGNINQHTSHLRSRFGIR